MRVDLFLKVSRLVPRRTVAQQLCESGAVKLNNAAVKSSHEVREGDLLSVRTRSRITTCRVLKIPGRSLSKADASTLYETISTESADNRLL